jgi:general secretion pathway protein E
MITADFPTNQTPLTSNAAPRQPPYSFAKRFRVLVAPRMTTAGTEVPADSAATKMPRPVRVWITDKTPATALLEIQRFLAQPIQVERVDETRLNAALAARYERSANEAMQAVEDADQSLDLARLMETLPETEDLLEQDDDAPIVRLINALLTEALREDASDIHIETFEQRILVRFRVDGVLREVLQPKRVLAQLLVSRIKVMAKLDIAEKRLPQDGRISLRIGEREVDVRVSTIPTRHGERVVLRLLAKSAGRLDLAVLGLAADDLASLRQVLAQPHGVILVTGPTGSGKSTTLYAALAALNDGSRNILTIEDPVEYDLPGIGQTQVNVKAGMSFARGLRAILRQDPDIVMIGEIRDGETAEIAIQASLTGHLLLSTLHTNTAIGAVTRLVDMGIEPFLVSSSLSALIAQRLVRRLCSHCREAYTPDTSTRQLLRCDDNEAVTLYRAVGCSHCHQQGYRGRLGIYEIIPVTEALRTLIHQRADEQTLTHCARAHSRDILSDGIAKVKAGATTVEELLRVVHAH